MERQQIIGPDFNKIDKLEEVFEYYKSLGIQSTNVHLAIEEIKKMLVVDEDQKKCKIVLGYTSNMISSGIREIIRYLVQHKMVDCLVTTTGGIEEDFMKCTADFFVGSFQNDDAALRNQQLMRIGNIFLKSENYQDLEDWFMPLLVELDKEQRKTGKVLGGSDLIRAMGKKIDNPESVYYWCYKNDIPVMCPALTDGAIGDMLFTFSFRHDQFVIDQMKDYRLFNDFVNKTTRMGAIILGSGTISRHIMRMGQNRGGFDYGLIINTELDIDQPEQPHTYVSIFSEVTLVFPFIVALTFFLNHKKNSNNGKSN